VGTHTAGSEIIDLLRPTTIAASLATMWRRVGIPMVIQFDNHSNLRGAIPPRESTFGPVVATCLDLGVIAGFAPLREPWRNGVVEHFNDVWDKSFFRTARYPDLSPVLGWRASPLSTEAWAGSTLARERDAGACCLR